MSDKKLAVSSNNTTIDYYTADVVTANDYYVFGMSMPGRNYSSNKSVYGFNGMRKDNDIYRESNAYDFGARMYDPRLGRWFSTDELEKKYPFFSPYVFAINSPLRIIDVDGKDIIILSAPNGAGGMGHAAVLIGSDKTGWTLYSKNGTFGSSGAISSGPSNNNPEAGVYVGSLSNFANSERNFHHGEVQYTAAFKISSSTTTLKNVSADEVDTKMKVAALKQVNSWYDVSGTFSGSCIDVVVDALNAGGFKGTVSAFEAAKGKGYIGKGFAIGQTARQAIPNTKYQEIVETNIGTNVSNQILPTEASKAKYKKENDDAEAAAAAASKPITLESVKQAVSPGGLQGMVNKIVKFLSTPR